MFAHASVTLDSDWLEKDVRSSHPYLLQTAQIIVISRTRAVPDW